MTPGQFSRGADLLRRAAPPRPLSGNAFLIVTEGAKTEPLYLNKLRDRFRLAAADIRVFHPPATDPLSLTRAAIHLKDERRRAVRRGEAGVVPYDEVWVVVDMEELGGPRRRQYEQVQELAARHRIRFAPSDPCFEYWLLLHETFTFEELENCSQAIKRLRRFEKFYSKSRELSPEFFDRLPMAIRHARQGRQRHRELGHNGTQNPSTHVDRLVCALCKSFRGLGRTFPNATACAPCTAE